MDLQLYNIVFRWLKHFRRERGELFIKYLNLLFDPIASLFVITLVYTCVVIFATKYIEIKTLHYIRLHAHPTSSLFYSDCCALILRWDTAFIMIELACLRNLFARFHIVLLQVSAKKL